MKYCLVFTIILFVAACADEQNAAQETPLIVMPKADGSIDQPKPFTRNDLVLMGRKFIDLWGGRYRGDLAERLFTSKDFDERILTSYVGGIYLTYPADNEIGLRRLAKDVTDGDDVSARLLGLIMYITGTEMLQSRPPMPQPDPDTVALFYAARHFGSAKAAAVLDARYSLLGDELREMSLDRSREYIRNPLALLDLSALGCEDVSRWSRNHCNF